MKRTPVISSNLKSVGYNPESMILEIEFNYGAIYHYFSVPQNIYNGLMNAVSKGTYFNDYIKDDYRYEKIS